MQTWSKSTACKSNRNTRLTAMASVTRKCCKEKSLCNAFWRGSVAAYKAASFPIRPRGICDARSCISHAFCTEFRIKDEQSKRRPSDGASAQFRAAWPCIGVGTSDAPFLGL
eukprot:6193487-Pleurochrysis_carterae.AAC.1